MSKKIVTKDDAITAPFNMSVAEDPASLVMTGEDALAIAGNLSGALMTMPADDFMPAVDVRTGYMEPRPATQMPKIIETLPADQRLQAIQWQQVKNLPGFALSQIRKMGGDVFNSFESFRDFSAFQKREGRDPHGEILVISDYTHGQTATNYLADLIAKCGVPFEVGENDYGDLLPGYRPKIITLQTNAWTFKLVQDRQEYGAPVNLNSIYAWPTLTPGLGTGRRFSLL